MAAEAEGGGDDEVKIEELGPDGEVVEPAEATDEDDGELPGGEEATKRSSDDELDRIEKEKKGMSVVEKLERSLLWKAEGNSHFKKNELFKAADCYYHAVLYCRELTQNPQYYPAIGHNEEQRKTAKEFCESVFTNLALVQFKYGTGLQPDDKEREKVLSEAAKSAGEALKINGKSVKALFRRGQTKAAMAKGVTVKNEEGQRLYGEAKTDFLAVVEIDSQNREARAELKEVQDQLKRLKKEEIASERKEFGFANCMAGVGAKQKDLLADGSVKKQMLTAGDGGKWLNSDWLRPGEPVKCVIHLSCGMVSAGDKDIPHGSVMPVNLSFSLGDVDMHDGVQTAIKSMTVGEVSRFTFAPNRLSAKGALASMLPDPKGQTSAWEITFIKFAAWEDVARDGERLQKIHSEGYGEFPETLAEVHMHWKVFGPDGNLFHSSRYVLNVAGEGGLKHVEDEDKDSMVYVLGESTWEPLTVLCKSLRQGGVGELRVRRMPELPKESGGLDAGSSAASAQLSMMMNKKKTGEALHHCVVRAELEKVVQPIRGPEDPRWEGTPAIIQERVIAETLLQKGEDAAALCRLRRVQAWAEQVEQDDVVKQALASARGSIGWALVCRAAPILDLGNVRSDVLAVARKDADEAEEHCAWLEEHYPETVGTKLLRAKLLVAQDDDFVGAHKKLLEAQGMAPDDRRVQEELKNVKVELRKVEEQENGKKVAEIRDNLKRARTDGNPEGVLYLLKELNKTKVSWDTIMETRIGVELKCCQEGGGDEVKQLCRDILGRFKDESKEQRPMWAA